MTRHKVYLTLICLSIALSMGCGSKDTKIVARVGNRMLTLTDYEGAFYRAKPISMAILNKIDVKRDYLDELVNREMKLQLIEQLGLRQSPDMVKQLEQAESRAAYIATLEKRIMYQIIKEDEIKSFYRKSGLEVRVRHILISAGGDTSKANMAKLQQESQEVLRLLRSGGNFSDLVKEYSDDEFSTRKGGDLGFLKWGAMDSLFMEAAMQTKRYQVYPDPIRTDKGLHIIQVTDRRKVILKPYDVVRPDIVQSLFNKYRPRILSRFQQFNNSLLKDYVITPQQENIKQAVDFLGLDNTDSLFVANLKPDFFDSSWIPKRSRELVLVTYQGGAYSLEDLFLYLARQTDRPPLTQLSADIIERLVLDEIKYKIAAQIGFENGYLKENVFGAPLKEQVEKVLLEKLQRDYIDQEAPITDEMVQTYFENNIKKYEMPPRADVQEILLPDSALAQEVMEKALSGTDFTALANEFNTRPMTMMEMGRLGRITASSYGMIGKTALAAEVNSIQGPIKTEEGFSVIKVLLKVPAEKRSFEDSKRRVRRDLSEEKRRERHKRWEDKMRASFPVRIYEDVLQQAFQDLT